MVAGTLRFHDKEGFAKMAQSITPTAGIDTSKDKLDIAITGRPGTFTVPNTKPGWTELAARLDQAGVGRVGIEATGGYERRVVRHLQAAGVHVLTLQPNQVKAWGVFRLQRAKSDSIDATLIAACTAVIDDSHKLPPDPRFDALADCLTFIEQNEDDKARFKTRLEHTTDRRLRGIYQRDIDRLEKRRATEIKRLIATLCQHDDLAKRFGLLLTIPGIAERTALSLVIRMPELGQISREQAASIAGLAPFVRDSGKRKGETHIGGGREPLRTALFMPAMAAGCRHNPALVALRNRLLKNHKPPKSIIIACARKLLIMANAVVARGTPWEERSAPA
jgi:transposase